jgi:ssDNA-binding Zn-finger/Zn-ribbon topoisomerase 1
MSPRPAVAKGARTAVRSTEVVQGALSCPSCTQALRALRLGGHYGREVELDVCGPCRLAWFDGREQMQLSGLGWIDLLEQLQEAQPALQPWRGEALACPRCDKPLRQQHNRTRWGLFVANACPDCHGALQSHAAILAERGLLRTPTATDREAMARSPNAWTCLNCGAAVADAQRQDCSWCQAPLLLFDFERLASALLPRPQDRATVSAGRLDMWPCQGCGFALDPTSHSACPQCGQGVLARSMAGLQPLLRRLRERWRQWLARPAASPPDAAGEAQQRSRAAPHWAQDAARRLMQAAAGRPTWAVTRWRVALAVVLLVILWRLYGST